ncbi:molybdopterin-binding protein [Pelagibacterium limicola]|uniref:molybdopterin-binding protein n=1 Tax=Pelagibacterium limicola TaxID=2791022 RepID=UPI0018B007C0|nr:molybdopterin-binding protein [Pelagibacterium limicola]
MTKFVLDRRKFLTVSAAGLASAPLAGCDVFDAAVAPASPVRGFMAGANELTFRAQRMVLGRAALAREFAESEIRQGMRPNGSTDPNSMEYMFLRQSDFALYKLEVGGLCEAPQSWSLDELRNMPSRTQITRHDCVEGWSCIAKWTGVPLAHVLAEVRPQATARYAVFHCFDIYASGASGRPYYESIDMIDAYHPQTILAYGMNDATLPVENGAPLRLRVERQLGYKMAKYISRIELVESFSHLHGGKGGYWEDHGYDWYAGI